MVIGIQPRARYDPEELIFYRSREKGNPPDAIMGISEKNALLSPDKGVTLVLYSDHGRALGSQTFGHSLQNPYPSLTQVGLCLPFFGQYTYGKNLYSSNYLPPLGAVK